MPGQRLEARIAAFGDGRDFRRDRRAFEAGDGQRPQLARLDVRQDADRVAEHDVQRAAHQITDGQRRAAIGHMRHLQTGFACEQLGDEMVGRADAGRAVVHRAGLAPGQRHELLHGLGGRFGIDDQDVGIGRRHGDRSEVLHRIVGQRLVDGRINRDRARLAEQQRIAIGLRLGDEIGADDRARAALVLDHDRLAGILRDLLGHDARHRIRPAARRVGDDELDRFGGIVLCKRRWCDGSQSQRTHGAPHHRLQCFLPQGIPLRPCLRKPGRDASLS